MMVPDAGACAYQGVIQDLFHRSLDFAVNRQDQGLAWLDFGDSPLPGVGRPG